MFLYERIGKKHVYILIVASSSNNTYPLTFSLDNITFFALNI